jgi:hypothetical protein
MPVDHDEGTSGGVEDPVVLDLVEVPGHLAQSKTPEKKNEMR